MNKDTGGPAFPFWSDSDGLAQYAGMTLRDYFAVKALDRLMARGVTMEIAAEYAYKYADAMLKAREQ